MRLRTSVSVASLSFIGIFFFHPCDAQEIEVTKAGGNYRLMVDGVGVADDARPMEGVKITQFSETVRAATWQTAAEDDANAPHYWYSLKVNDREWTRAKRTTYQIKLKNRTFEPLTTDNALQPNGTPAALRAPTRSQLYLVQFTTQVLQQYRDAIRDAGGEVHAFIPELTHIVQMSPEVKAKVDALPFVRWVGPMLPYYKLEKSVLASLAVDSNTASKTRYAILATSIEERRSLERRLTEMNATISERGTGTDILVAELTKSQLQSIASDDSVLWVELSTKPEIDTDNARLQGGGNYLEAMTPGYTGIGLRGHVLEGIHQSHPDFKANAHRQAPIAVNDGSSSGHGTNTYGQIFSDGSGNDPNARGLLPNAQGLYTHYNFVYSEAAGSTALGSRYELTSRLISEHRVMFQTASWGYSRVTGYDIRSKEMDDIIFAHDIPVTQSQSNSGGLPSRPQAWAKNIISVGGAYHFNNPDPGDDRWNNGASTGPAEEGRVKPDLCAYYDQINTTEGSTGYTSFFGGTSGATPMVAGHMGLVLEMWTNGAFGNSLPHPATPQYRFENRPHATTTKALLICSASQYQFPPSTDLDRYRQGWGFPDLKTLYDNRCKTLVVNESDVLETLESKSYTVTVDADEPMLRVTLVYAEPGGMPAASGSMLLNNLDLKITDPAGNVYWGNNGLLLGRFSQLGGTPNSVDNVENVFIQTPAPGRWVIEVIADDLTVDSHTETPQVDADYALVAIGVSR